MEMSGKRASAAVPVIEEHGQVEAATEQERLAADLKRLRDLLERDRVEEARRFVKELEQRWPEAERVRHYAHVLAPPKVRSRPDLPPQSSERELKWLKEHAHEYPGCWLAVYEDRLIAADPDLQVVVKQVREAIGEQSAFVFYQPDESTRR
jgi:hypothetical protein